MLKSFSLYMLLWYLQKYDVIKSSLLLNMNYFNEKPGYSMLNFLVVYFFYPCKEKMSREKRD